MRKRPFSLSEIARQVIAERNRGQEGGLPPIPEKEILEAPSETHQSFSAAAITAPETSRPDQALNDDIQMPKPRKVKPVIIPDTPQPPAPGVPLKTGPKTTVSSQELAAEMSLPRQPNADDGPRPSTWPVEPKATPFGERYGRITTYLEKSLFRRVHELHRRGEVAKIAGLLNAAVREYLDRHYPCQ